MAESQPHEAFGEMLTEGIRQLALHEAMRKVQADLAETLGYSTSAIYAWRRGKNLPEPPVIETLARIFVQGWGADQDWIDRFLEKGDYRPERAKLKLYEELFGGSVEGSGEDQQSEGGPGGGNLFIDAWKSWSESIFRWSEASDHMRSSWAGLTIHALGAVTDRLNPGDIFFFLVTLTLWFATAWLLEPLYQWPLEEISGRGEALIKFSAATLVVPFVVAIVTRPDRYEDFELNTIKARLILGLLKYTGALVGFYTFAMITLSVVLLWYYLGGPRWSTVAVWFATLVPLFWSYVTARRIPADRLNMFRGELRAHQTDYLFLGTFLVVGPLTALFIFYYYWFLADRTIAPPIILLTLIVMAWWEARKRRRKR